MECCLSPSWISGGHIVAKEREKRHEREGREKREKK